MLRSTARVIELEDTGSTNADAMHLAVSGERLPLWVQAELQSAGRGRDGRKWLSERGNIHASLAIHCRAPVLKAGELALVAGVALIGAIRSASCVLAAAPTLRLKWPNDVLVGVAKVGGILVETTVARGEPGFLAVLGFGLNVNTAPEGTGRVVTALRAHDPEIDVSSLANALRAETESAIETWNDGEGFAAVCERWRAQAGPFGEKISVHTRSGPIEGTYEGLSPTGGLLARIGPDIQEIKYGDVSLAGETREGGGA